MKKYTGPFSILGSVHVFVEIPSLQEKVIRSGGVSQSQLWGLGSYSVFLLGANMLNIGTKMQGE